MDILDSGFRVFVADLLNSVIGFFGILYFASELGPASVGIFFLFQTLLGLTSIVADLGVDDAIEKRLSERADSAVYFWSGVAMKSATVSVVSGCVLALGTIVNSYLGTQLAPALALGIVVREAYNTVVKTLNGRHRVGETAVLKLGNKAVWFGLGFALIHFGFGLLAIVYSLLVGYFLSVLWGIWLVSIPLAKPSLTQIQSLFDYSKFQFVSRLGGEVFNWMDLFFIGLFLTTADVGQYEVAWRITTIVMVFSGAISTALFPKVSYWFDQGEFDRIEQELPKLITLSVVFVIPAFFGTLVLSDPILRFTFGGEYASAWLVLIVLMSYKPFQAVQSILGRSLLAIDQPHLAARATIVSVFLNLILNVALIYEFGLIGAAIATITSSLVSDGMHYRYLSKWLSIDIEVRKLAWFVFSALGMATVIAGVKRLFPVASTISLSAIIATGVLVYVLLIGLFPPVRADISRYTKTLLPSR